ncbi:hypothetical protein, partial [Staphylococcus capitis]|uniref:hypothetical protein n=1 Tax=Staphylococcus capitis TaxID=29388 RepID=UPI0016425468
EFNGLGGKEGASSGRGSKKIIGRYGVLYLVWNLVNSVGIIGEGGIENKRGVEVIKKGLSGVKIGIAIGIGNRGR